MIDSSGSIDGSTVLTLCDGLSVVLRKDWYLVDNYFVLTRIVLVQDVDRVYTHTDLSNENTSQAMVDIVHVVLQLRARLLY